MKMELDGSINKIISKDNAKIVKLRIIYTYNDIRQKTLITILMPIHNPLTINTTAEATMATKNLPVRSPSRVPPGAMGLATPFLRHLARPRDAEMTEMM